MLKKEITLLILLNTFFYIHSMNTDTNDIDQESINSLLEYLTYKDLYPSTKYNRTHTNQCESELSKLLKNEYEFITKKTAFYNQYILSNNIHSKSFDKIVILNPSFFEDKNNTELLHTTTSTFIIKTSSYKQDEIIVKKIIDLNIKYSRFQFTDKTHIFNHVYDPKLINDLVDKYQDDLYYIDKEKKSLFYYLAHRYFTEDDQDLLEKIFTLYQDNLKKEFQEPLNITYADAPIFECFWNSNYFVAKELWKCLSDEQKNNFLVHRGIYQDCRIYFEHDLLYKYRLAIHIKDNYLHQENVKLENLGNLKDKVACFKKGSYKKISDLCHKYNINIKQFEYFEFFYEMLLENREVYDQKRLQAILDLQGDELLNPPKIRVPSEYDSEYNNKYSKPISNQFSQNKILFVFIMLISLELLYIRRQCPSNSAFIPILRLGLADFFGYLAEITCTNEKYLQKIQANRKEIQLQRLNLLTKKEQKD